MVQPIRVLVAKPGLDGHDRGALVIAQGLRDQGMEVIYSGLRQTPEQIVQTAIEEDVACIGLSSLSGAHMEWFPEVARLLRERGADDVLLIGGGVIPPDDAERLKQLGIAEVFGPGTSIQQVADFIRQHVRAAGPACQLAPVATASVRVSGVDHVAVAVRDIAAAIEQYGRVLGARCLGVEEVPDQGVRVAFLSLGGTVVELVEPTAPDSPVARFLDRRGPGLHHIAYAVDDVDQALAVARAAGARVIDERPRPGARGKRIAFLHPGGLGGVLTELCQRSAGEGAGES
ncbi:MAG: methylmalonyl-CoA epimerase [Alicyclobacillaceae bacterium]|nr:methylmalonyl-CoA epimerase [Alicyclobacillaceae bacterium]